MNNYLLMGRLLRCNVIPAEEVHPELWVGANKKWRKVPRARLEKVRNDKVSAASERQREGDQASSWWALVTPTTWLSIPLPAVTSVSYLSSPRRAPLTPQPRTKEQQERANTKVLKRQEDRRQKIKAAGIDYSFDGHK